MPCSSLRSSLSWTIQLIFLLLASFTYTSHAAYGDTGVLEDNRQPALWTENFGDCNGGSLIDVSRFDAALYLDNSSVTFHLEGNALVTGMSSMMFFTVYAYGEQRFTKFFDPCQVSIDSLCPSNISVPVEVDSFIPLAPSDINNIPTIAYSIPDFEGQAVLRIFDNATESEIACYSAMITNGNTMSWPTSVGIIMGLVIFAALLASFLAATYGNDIMTTRTHYAHSMSILVVIATLQHVYFTGALSMNWASVLPAFWSNFAWSGGIIYSPSMQNSINTFNGNNFGNTSFVGAAGVGQADNTAGGYDIAQIYKRALSTRRTLADALAGKPIEEFLQPRSLPNASEGFYWYGDPVTPGLPIPGNFTGFPGTLSFQSIPASNAFLTGFLWLLILIVILAAGLAFLKGALELLIRLKRLRSDRLHMFRQYWIGFTAMVLARTIFAAFFMIMFLCFFQFAYGGAAAMKAITAIIFVIFLVCTTGIVSLSVYYRLRNAKRVPDRLHLELRTAWKVLPYMSAKLQSSRESEQKPAISLFSVPCVKFDTEESEYRHDEVHQDESYIRRYGWLVSRFRKSKWWFPCLWLVYELIRALFFGAAAGHPSVQVFGLLIVEFISLIAMIKTKPFESRRLNVLMIYLLGLSKVVTVALSSAFHPDFGLQRVVAAGIAFVIIVIQGLLLIVMMLLTCIGFFSTFFSLSRNREALPNENWMELRTKYFKHVEVAAKDDKLAESKPKKQKQKEKEKESVDVTTPGFNVGSVKRLTRIEDEDQIALADQELEEFSASLAGDDSPSTTRPGSSYSHMNSSRTSLPYGARPFRQSWSRDVSPTGYGSGRMSFSSNAGLRSAGSDPNLRNSYGITPSNRSSNFVPGVTGNRRSRSSTYNRSVPAVAEEPSELPLPLPVNAVDIVTESLKSKGTVVADEITTSPIEMVSPIDSKSDAETLDTPKTPDQATHNTDHTIGVAS